MSLEKAIRISVKDALCTVNDVLGYFRDARQLAPLHTQNKLAHVEVLLVDAEEALTEAENGNDLTKIESIRETIEKAKKATYDLKMLHTWVRLANARGDLQFVINALEKEENQ